MPPSPPPGFVVGSTEHGVRFGWHTRDAGIAWAVFVLTAALTAGGALLVGLGTRDPVTLASAGILLGVGLAGCALQVVHLRRGFFLELQLSQLITNTAPDPVPLSDLARVARLKREVERKGEKGSTIETWFELWLHLRSGARIQIGSRMESDDAWFLRNELCLRAPQAASIDEASTEDLREPRKWIGRAGAALLVPLLFMTFSFGVRSWARGSAVAREALALAEADPRVRAALGAPLSWGWHAELYTPKTHAARLTADVRGPNGSGRLTADGYFKDGAWCFALAQVRPDGADAVVPLAQPCLLTGFERAEVYYVPPPSKGGGH